MSDRQRSTMISHGHKNKNKKEINCEPSGSAESSGATPTAEKKQDPNDKYLRTVFHELSSPREIHTLLKRCLPSPEFFPIHSADPNGRDNFGLRPIADFTTTRDTFLSDARFRVVLDETCFGHRVGEVEVEVEVPAAAAGGEEKQVQREIDGFMERYAWFFLVEKAKVKGKLTAYFERFPVKI